MSAVPWAGDASYNIHNGDGGGLDWERLRAEHDARLAQCGEVTVGDRSEGTGPERLERSRHEANLILAGNRRRASTVRGGTKRQSEVH
jgi:hypothetical protein